MTRRLALTLALPLLACAPEGVCDVVDCEPRHHDDDPTQDRYLVALEILDSAGAVVNARVFSHALWFYPPSEDPPCETPPPIGEDYNWWAQAPLAFQAFHAVDALSEDCVFEDTMRVEVSDEDEAVVSIDLLGVGAYAFKTDCASDEETVYCDSGWTIDDSHTFRYWVYIHAPKG